MGQLYLLHTKHIQVRHADVCMCSGLEAVMEGCVKLEEMCIVIWNLTVMKIHAQAPKHACTHAHTDTQKWGVINK